VGPHAFGSEFDFLLDLCADFPAQMRLSRLWNTILLDLKNSKPAGS
jgi:hypothetical protein